MCTYVLCLLSLGYNYIHTQVVGNCTCMYTYIGPAVPAVAPPTVTAESALLVDDLNIAADVSGDTLTPGAEEGFMKFLLKNNGVLFENDILQIGIKSEYKKNLGLFHCCTYTCTRSLKSILCISRSDWSVLWQQIYYTSELHCNSS